MNILTFDIEEWALAKAGGYGAPERYAKYDTYLNRILDLLDERSITATFFCTGAMADEFPNVVRLIHSRGHEIGCHSYRHTWMNKMSEAEAKEDTHIAVDALEQCIGQKVLSYRAPAFSIGETNKWMFDVLAGEGITRDASIFPAERDFGGFPSFSHKEPCTIEYDGIKIKEFPVSTTRLFGREMAYSGGGYFRIFPLSFVENRLQNSEYAMCYFHMADFIDGRELIMRRGEYEAYFKEKGTLKNRTVRYIKSRIGRKTALKKLLELLSCMPFICLMEADDFIDWKKVPAASL